MTPPLADIRVLDVTNVLAGPFCSYQLALLGAEVIKIEQPGRGDLARMLGADRAAAEKLMGASFVAVNAGKQSVTVNLKTSKGKEIFKKFAAISHAVIENFRPDVMKRLQLDYSVLSQINQSIVYCSLSGFGQDGPLAMRPAYDQIIQGMSGIMSVTGDGQTAPLRVGYPVCDTVGGLTAALAVCAALVEARSTGQGRAIDVSMLESTLASMGWIVSNYLNAGVIPVPMGNENFTAAPSGTFQTADGPLNIAANETYQFEKLCDLIGRPDLKADPRFQDREIRKKNRAAINREVEQGLVSRGAAEWEVLLSQEGVPAGRVFTVPEILSHPHLTERCFVTRFDCAGGRQTVTRGGFTFSDHRAVPPTPAARLSEHTEAWLRKLGYSAQEIQGLRKEGVI
jgi:CoA:oxalate CoA-transferase